MELDMVAEMEEDKVANIEVDTVADINIDINNEQRHQHWHPIWWENWSQGLGKWAQTFRPEAYRHAYLQQILKECLEMPDFCF